MPDERILIVDDDPWILRMVITLLEKRGHQVVTASDGETALQKAREMVPHLVITDVMMPKLDGWGLVRALRSDPKLAFIPVIFLTALSGDEDRIRGFRLGADDYLPKPFRFEELDLRVANALKKAQHSVRRLGDIVAPPSTPTATTGANSDRTAGVRGALSDLGLSSLLVMLELERKSGVLRVIREQSIGRIFVREGRVIAARVESAAAEAENRKAVDAVFHLLSWSDGHFDFSALAVEMEDEVKSSTTHLLLEGARRLDEAAK